MTVAEQSAGRENTARHETSREDARSSLRSFVLTKKFLIPAIASLCLAVLAVAVLLFRPSLPYVISSVSALDIASEDFTKKLETLADATLHPRTRIEVLEDGPRFYEAQLQAIRDARQTINLELYIFEPGTIGDRVRSALVASARRGVAVNVVVDAIGSKALPGDYLEPLEKAGGRVARYHPVRWHNVDRLNNRTHRNLLIVDGRIGFTGGAGVSDVWLTGSPEAPMWHDTVFRIQGPAVGSLQSTFIENWLESTGELLSPDDYFRFEDPAGDSPVLVVDSTPSAGGSTRARMVIQTLIASARTRIWINNPYFIPDAGIRQALIQAVQRGVDVQVVTPGAYTDHRMVQATSRALYGELIRGGVQIHEYQPRMIHEKAMLVDGVWSVIGTTNLDPRSFALNDEVNVLVGGDRLTRQLEEAFRKDREQSKRWSYEDWQQRGLADRAMGWLGMLFRRQQ